MVQGTRLLGWLLTLALGLTAAHAQTPPRPTADQAIGSWVLSCPADAKEPCVLRHRDWVLPPSGGGPSGALEVQMRGGVFVPVITLRGLPTSAAVGGSFVVKPTVNVGFDGGKRVDLGCGISGTVYACAPGAEAVPGLSAQLPKARTIAAAVTLTLPGILALPPQERSMDLTGTEAALTRLRAAGAIDEALPDVPGLDLQGFLDRVMRDLGFPNGAADVMPYVLPLLNWARS